MIEIISLIAARAPLILANVCDELTPSMTNEPDLFVDQNARNILFLAVANTWVMAFLGERESESFACQVGNGVFACNTVHVLMISDAHSAEGYCWARTAERQASRMRERYLRAVLRQDVVYFDLKVGSTSEVITSVSNDSLVVQDVLSEKVPNFVMNCSLFLGSYAFVFVLLWRLTLVALPSVLLLIIPGFIYGRIVIGLARRIREQYTRPGAVAEQAVSSVRTVYSFVAERSTMAQFSAALEESARLGIKQGLAKGVSIGSNGITFSIWAFNVWYGSRLVKQRLPGRHRLCCLRRHCRRRPVCNDDTISSCSSVHSFFTEI
jgi:ATP-binding cassette, subfamily B (MDR/TAP), member 1